MSGTWRLTSCGWASPTGRHPTLEEFTRQLIAMGWVQPLSAGLIPNAAYLRPQFRDWPVPDIRRHSLAWQAGFTGIGYNAQATRRPVTSMTDLLTAPDLHGRVSLVADMRDVMGLILLDLGSDPSDFSTAEFNAALASLSRSVLAGQIRIVTDYYLPELIKEPSPLVSPGPGTSCSGGRRTPTSSSPGRRAAACSGPTTG